MLTPDTYGSLIITLFVASPDSQHRGGARRLACIPCKLEAAPGIWKAWQETNPALKAGYNSPISAEFRPESIPMD